MLENQTESDNSINFSIFIKKLTVSDQRFNDSIL